MGKTENTVAKMAVKIGEGRVSQRSGARTQGRGWEEGHSPGRTRSHHARSHHQLLLAAWDSIAVAWICRSVYWVPYSCTASEAETSASEHSDFYLSFRLERFQASFNSHTAISDTRREWNSSHIM